MTSEDGGGGDGGGGNEAGGGGDGGGAFWNNGSGVGDAYNGNNQRLERGQRGHAALSVLPLSPAWSAEDDVNRGTGVRRRVSPRASAGAGVSGRSPRRGAGWASPLSPMSPMSPVPPNRREVGGGNGGGGGGGGKELRPLALAYSEDEPAAVATATAVSPVPHGRDARSKNHFRPGVGTTATVAIEETGGRGVVAAAAAAGKGQGQAGGTCSPVRAPRRASKTLLAAGANKNNSNEAAAEVATPKAAPAVAEATTGGEEDAGVENVNIAEEVTVRRVGLRCSAPIYDRSRNMLGSSGADGGGDGREGQEGEGDEDVDVDDEGQPSTKRLGARRGDAMRYDAMMMRGVVLELLKDGMKPLEITLVFSWFLGNGKPFGSAQSPRLLPFCWFSCMI